MTFANLTLSKNWIFTQLLVQNVTQLPPPLPLCYMTSFENAPLKLKPTYSTCGHNFIVCEGLFLGLLLSLYISSMFFYPLYLYFVQITFTASEYLFLASFFLEGFALPMSRTCYLNLNCFALILHVNMVVVCKMIITCQLFENSNKSIPKHIWRTGT